MRMRENAAILEIEHSRVGLSLCVKTCLRVKPFIRKCNLVVDENVFHQELHFHARGLVFEKQAPGKSEMSYCLYPRRNLPEKSRFFSFFLS